MVEVVEVAGVEEVTETAMETVETATETVVTEMAMVVMAHRYK